MTILDFEDFISDNNIERGNRYFRQARVTDLTETSPGDWEANVEGRMMYETTVMLNDENEVDATDCTCPVFTEEAHCKHVVATFYAIRKKLGIQPAVPLSDEQIEALVQVMPADALRSFMIAQLEDEDNKPLRRAFQALGHEQMHAIPVEQYSKAMANDPTGLLASAKQQLKACKEAFKIKNYTEVVSRSLAVLTVLPFAKENTEADKKKIKTLIQDAFWQLYDLFDIRDLDEYNTLRIYQYAARLVQDPHYPVADYDPHWVDLLWQNIESNNDKEVLSLLDAMVATAGNNNNPELLERLKTINRHYREMVGAVKAEKPAPSDKQMAYSNAKQLLLDAMQEAREKNETAVYNSHRDDLLTLMQQRSDVLPLRKLATECFKETHHPKYLEMLKGTYMNAEWEKVKAAFETSEKNSVLRAV